MINHYDIRLETKYGLEIYVLEVSFDDGSERTHTFMSDFGLKLKLQEYGIRGISC